MNKSGMVLHVYHPSYTGSAGQIIVLGHRRLKEKQKTKPQELLWKLLKQKNAGGKAQVDKMPA
jgi:hypothetical protein